MTGSAGELRAVLDVAESILAELDVEVVLSRVLEAARTLMSARYAAVGVLDELITNPRPLRLDDLGSHPRSYGFPAGHPPMTTFLGVPLVVAGAPYGNLYLTDKTNGEPFSAEDERALLLLAQFAGIALDHARRFAQVEAQRSELQRAVAALDATVQIARAVGGETNLDVVLELVAKRGRAS